MKMKEEMEKRRQAALARREVNLERKSHLDGLRQVQGVNKSWTWSYYVLWPRDNYERWANFIKLIHNISSYCEIYIKLIKICFLDVNKGIELYIFDMTSYPASYKLTNLFFPVSLTRSLTLRRYCLS